jgi:hypothetical protein
LWSRLLARTVLARNEAPQGLESCPSGCILVVLLRTPAGGSAKCAVYPAWVWSLSCFLICRIPVLAAGGRAWPGPEARGG